MAKRKILRILEGRCIFCLLFVSPPCATDFPCFCAATAALYKMKRLLSGIIRSVTKLICQLIPFRKRHHARTNVFSARCERLINIYCVFGFQIVRYYFSCRAGEWGVYGSCVRFFASYLLKKRKREQRWNERRIRWKTTSIQREHYSKWKCGLKKKFNSIQFNNFY